MDSLMVRYHETIDDLREFEDKDSLEYRQLERELEDIELALDLG